MSNEWEKNKTHNYRLIKTIFGTFIIRECAREIAEVFRRTQGFRGTQFEYHCSGSMDNKTLDIYSACNAVKPSSSYVHYLPQRKKRKERKKNR